MFRDTVTTGKPCASTLAGRGSERTRRRERYGRGTIQDSAIVPGVRGISSFRGNGNLCLKVTCVQSLDSKIEAWKSEFPGGNTGMPGHVGRRRHTLNPRSNRPESEMVDFACRDTWNPSDTPPAMVGTTHRSAMPEHDRSSHRGNPKALAHLNPLPGPSTLRTGKPCFAKTLTQHAPCVNNPRTASGNPR